MGVVFQKVPTWIGVVGMGSAYGFSSVSKMNRSQKISKKSRTSCVLPKIRTEVYYSLDN
ncbi:MAG: hypothetical protein UV20_C0014G0008 [Candidatus Magasanikbacteria bacterium GW2011_GWA2_42_32]|uniref:Uncharacterized protein n=1 Tax=Candidatus Magasanikbacteria bacterium GW2011_GWA2_42_32 TaxID=1619039 RepID=A0A0G1D300_9BACT|nr:MAG: hypothetical protein UV20_C0014G0008 [Candidatus Magasanikbacteria bacterium GW2011_GWA2_42_32]